MKNYHCLNILRPAVRSYIVYFFYAPTTFFKVKTLFLLVCLTKNTQVSTSEITKFDVHVYSTDFACFFCKFNRFLQSTDDIRRSGSSSTKEENPQERMTVTRRIYGGKKLNKSK